MNKASDKTDNTDEKKPYSKKLAALNLVLFGSLFAVWVYFQLHK